MISFNQRVLESKFSKWIEEEIYLSTGIQHGPRKYVILDFIHDLCELVKAHGYCFRASEKEMAQEWARYLFRCQYDLMKNRHVQANPQETPEDYDWFCNRFDYTVTEPFIRKWCEADDYTGSYAKQEALNNTFLFAWFFIDINASSQTAKVDEMMATSESEDDGKNKNRRGNKSKGNDPYLDDQANASSKYNRWD